MNSLWDSKEAETFKNSDLEMRAYTSRLLGLNEDLVLHGGGNTSVKINEKNIFGEEEEILYVKGSGWNLQTIMPQGFSPCRLDQVKKLGSLEKLSDMDMVRELKASMKDPGAPTPSIETILHGLIPFKFVDHTHADAVVIISNSPNGEQKLKDVFGDEVLILDYIMPGFILAKQVYEATQKANWDKLKGIILLHHGVFTFNDDAKVAYENMIELVSKAEDYLKDQGAYEKILKKDAENTDALTVATIRKEAMDRAHRPFLVRLRKDQELSGFSSHPDLKEITSRGPITPDHIIHTKRIPLIFGQDIHKDFDDYQINYQVYFDKFKSEEHTILDPVPRYGFIPNQGAIVIAPNAKRLAVISDIMDHTVKAVQMGETLGKWAPLNEKDLFEVEYWELEQAKLKKGGAPNELEGKVALVTGAANGIGLACVKKLLKEGAAVIGLDINPSIREQIKDMNYLGLECDVTSTENVKNCIDQAVKHFGGIDIIVSNAGNFPKSLKVEELDDETLDKTFDLNFTSHLRIIRESIPFLKLGKDPNVVVIGSKNVPAPGPGAAAYSCSKAALSQLTRVASLELAPFGIRFNVLHPNAVFDTGLWTESVLEQRAKNYQMSVEEYKKNNLLKTTITSEDVANLTYSVCTAPFSKTTGAQIPIDGGNERVI